MKCYLRIISLVLLGVNTSRGQDTTGTAMPSSFHVLGITIGFNQVKEENLHPRVHTGFITSLSYGHRRIGERYQDFRFALGFSRILATPEDVTKSANALITSTYSYCFQVIDEPSIAYYIGPEAKLAYSVFFYPNWDDSHLYWGNSLSLGISNAVLYSFQNDTRLFSTLSISLLSLYSRPEILRLYKIDDTSFGGIVSNIHKDMTFGFVTTAFSLHWDIEYQFPVFQTKTEALFYSIDYAHIAEGNALPFSQLFHQLGLRIFL